MKIGKGYTSLAHCISGVVGVQCGAEVSRVRSAYKAEDEVVTLLLT